MGVRTRAYITIRNNFIIPARKIKEKRAYFEIFRGLDKTGMAILLSLTKKTDRSAIKARLIGLEFCKPLFTFCGY